MKTQIRIATDPYSYIEVEVDGTALEIAQAYKDLKKAMDAIRPKEPEAPERPETPFPSRGDLGACKDCGAKMVNNPKTGKNFCSDKCWLKK